MVKTKISTKKIVAIIGVAIAVIAAVFIIVKVMTSGGKLPIVETAELTKSDIISTISVTGNVVSENTKKVFSYQGLPIDDVLVEVGDTVKEGDILCILDTYSLENSIKRTQQTVSREQQAANLRLEDAKKALEDAKSNQKNNLSAELAAAEDAVKNAELALESAGLDVTNARRDVKDYRDRNPDYEVYEQPYNDLDTASRKAMVNYNAAKDRLEQAKAQLKIAKENYSQGLEKLESSVKSAQIGVNLSDQYTNLEALNKNLEDATITSPMAGVVTAVYATEGAGANGLLFVVEDIENLKIETKITEYNVEEVKVGNRSEIRSDATGDAVYEGELHKIAPASIKNAAGDVTSGSDIEFEAEVKVKSKDTPLRIGMKTRVEIVVDERHNVFSVPYDAVVTLPDGTEAVFVATEDGNGGKTARQILVETGLENDFDVEISSDELVEGMELIFSPEGLTDGMSIQTVEGVAGAGTVSGGAPVFMIR